MIALRILWLMSLSLFLWALCTIITGQWWVGPVVIAALVVYAITDQNAKQKAVRETYREMIAAQERARQAAADAAASAAEAEVAQAQVRLLREHPELFR